MEPTQSYVFGENEVTAEEHRLDLLAELFDPATQRILQQLGLPRSGRFLEVGAGLGSVVTYLLAQCGSRGQVVATDIDTRFLDRLRHPQLVVVRHDLLEDDLGELGQFDVVHARFVLTHLGSRAGEGLERLVSLLAPRGRIVVEDPLWDNRFDPSYPDASRLEAEEESFEPVMREGGFDMRVSMTFPRRLVELGMSDVGSEIVGAVRRGGDLYSQFVNASVEASAPTLDYDSTYEGGGDGVVNMNLDPGLFYVSWHRLAAWGTNPD